LKEGDGITVYITLADAQGRLTRAEGFLSIEIREGTDGTVAWMQRRYVTPEDFEVATVGLGTFARTTLLYNFGRIAASTLGLRPRGQRLTVAVSFFKDGQHLAGEQSVWL
jgi:hypothetical protein